jgi:hypothetical protein
MMIITKINISMSQIYTHSYIILLFRVLCKKPTLYKREEFLRNAFLLHIHIIPMSCAMPTYMAYFRIGSHTHIRIHINVHLTFWYYRNLSNTYYNYFIILSIPLTCKYQSTHLTSREDFSYGTNSWTELLFLIVLFRGISNLSIILYFLLPK